MGETASLFIIISLGHQTRFHLGKNNCEVEAVSKPIGQAGMTFGCGLLLLESGPHVKEGKPWLHPMSQKSEIGI